MHCALDRESKRTFANGMLTSHAFAAAGNQISLSNIAPSGAALARYTADYDQAGNRTQVGQLDRTLVTYGYDRSNQLTDEERSGVNAYQTSYAYNGPGKRVRMSNSRQLATCAHNAANQLVNVTSGNVGNSAYPSHSAYANVQPGLPGFVQVARPFTAVSPPGAESDLWHP